MSADAVDASGVALRLARPPRRVVSLVPSLTEALFALGAGEPVAGVTRYCEEPAEAVAALPKVGGTKNPDLAAIAALAPDLVIASSEENREADVAALRASGLTVFVTHYPTVTAALDGIERLARILAVDPSGIEWLEAARAAVAECAARRERPVRYFCPIWRRPYMVARRDTYMADLLALAGGTSAFPEHGPAHYFTVELDGLPAAAPEVILLPDEPYRFGPRHLAEFAPFAGVPAVAHGRIHLVDGKALTWYGPRIAPALRLFSNLLRTEPGAALAVATGEQGTQGRQ
ncbi:MAG TPA: helical backbone metal receptor [Dehalococcoidia bacterium]|nr:helical backbone metal receptor [Dehalococcoidia bacterium]